MKNGDEPAFPAPDGFPTGLTKREYLAAHALAGIMANPVRWADVQRRYDKGELSYAEASRKNAAKALSLADAVLDDTHMKPLERAYQVLGETVPADGEWYQFSVLLKREPGSVVSAAHERLIPVEKPK